MRKLITLFAAILFSSLIAFGQDKINNNSVIQMVEAGLDNEVIISVIGNSEVAFDVSPAQLGELKAKGIPGAIVAEMIKANSKQASLEAQKAGIFFLDAEGKEVRIMPTVFSGTKTSTAAAAFSGGLANANVKSTLNGAQSQNKITPGQQEFFFYFNANAQSNFNDVGGISDWWFKQASSPTEFALVALESNPRKNERSVKTGKVNAIGGMNVGINSRDIIQVTVEKVGNTSYKVVPKDPLEPGEYCFFYQGTVPQGGLTNQSIFDFTVQ